MVEALNDIPQETLILGVSSKARLTAREYTNGLTEVVQVLAVKFMMVSGTWASNMGMACGQLRTETATSESGSIVRLKAMVYSDGRTVIAMKESGSSALNTVTALIYSQIGTHIKESLEKVKHMGAGSTIGMTVQCMWANS
jgi:hypothetical protein